MKKKIYTYNEIVKLTRQIENKETVETKELLMRKDEDGDSVAHWLAYNSNRTGWSTESINILMLQNKYGDSVAHLLAEYHPTWSTDILEVLSLNNRNNRTVEDVIIERSKI